MPIDAPSAIAIDGAQTGACQHQRPTAHHTTHRRSGLSSGSHDPRPPSGAMTGA
jgi:hypothetical protein